MLLALLASLASAGECSGDRVPPSAVKAEADAAMMAFSALDEDGFLESYQEALELLSCVDSAVDPRDAAVLHRLEGIKRFLEGNDAGAQRAFETSLVLEPGYSLPASIAPPGGPLARLFAAASSGGGAGTATLTTDKGTLLIDGKPTPKVSDERPAIVQVARSRAIVWSGYWGPEGLPSWFDVAWNEGGEDPDAGGSDAVVDLEGGGDRRSGSTTRTSDSRTSTTRTSDSRTSTTRTSDSRSSSSRTDDSRSSSSRDRDSRERDERVRDNMRLDPPKKADAGPRGAVGIAAIATGAVAATLYGVAAGSRISYDNDPTDGKRSITNGTYFGSVGLGLVAGGLGVAWLAMPAE